MKRFLLSVAGIAVLAGAAGAITAFARKRKA